MKKLLSLFVISCVISTVSAQQQGAMQMADSLSPRWCLDINLKGGMVSQDISSANFTSHYLNALNDTIGNLKFTNGASYEFDMQVAYFFDKKRHFGVGTGISLLWQQGNMTMDKFHIEYASIDAQSPVTQAFRQLITANGPISEAIRSTNINIPLALKYKTPLSRKLGLGVDVGVLFNLQMHNSYSTNASFDYEAIYKFAQSGSGYIAVYDNSPVPDGVNEQFITKKQIGQENTGINVAAHFDTLRNQGYNVGLNQRPGNNSGTVSYAASVGFFIQPSLSYRLNEYLSINVGAYYIMQAFNSNNNTNYKLTDKAGTYNSILNSADKIQSNSYGLNLGLRIYFDKKLLNYLLWNTPL